MASRQVLVIQDGARLHYAIPAVLQRAGLLRHVYTNWYASPWSLMKAVSRAVGLVKKDLGRRLLGRYSHDLNAKYVTAFGSMAWQERRGHGDPRFPTVEAHYQWLLEKMGKLILRKGWKNADTVFGFMRNIDPAVFHAARQAGLTTIADQIIAPYAVELAEQRLQLQRYHGWAKGRAAIEETWDKWEERTWNQLDHLTCASEYVKQGLILQGVPADKVTVIPYPINAAHFPAFDRRGRTGDVVVGFVGAVNLRKGSPYFAEVARRVGKGVKFKMVGPVVLSEQGIAEMKASGVELVGGVPRSRVIEELRGFDVLLFPSTCEGSAGSVMEAMATELPVVCSPNSGSLVDEGKSGFVREYSDIDGMAAAISKLAGNAELRHAMGKAARNTILACTIEESAKRWSTMLAALTLKK